MIIRISKVRESMQILVFHETVYSLIIVKIIIWIGNLSFDVGLCLTAITKCWILAFKILAY